MEFIYNKFNDDAHEQNHRKFKYFYSIISHGQQKKKKYMYEENNS